MCARPCKPRNCGCPFYQNAFKPTGIPMTELEKISLGRDELEALRLCDFEGLDQTAAGERMGISRGTVQRLLAKARYKVTKALVTQSAIVFEPITEEVEE